MDAEHAVLLHLLEILDVRLQFICNPTSIFSENGELILIFAHIKPHNCKMNFGFHTLPTQKQIFIFNDLSNFRLSVVLSPIQVRHMFNLLGFVSLIES